MAAVHGMVTATAIIHTGAAVMVTASITGALTTLASADSITGDSTTSVGNQPTTLSFFLVNVLSKLAIQAQLTTQQTNKVLVVETTAYLVSLPNYKARRISI